MIPKKISTMFSHDRRSGVKCMVTRGAGEPFLHGRVFVGGVVVAHDVQLAARICPRDLLQEFQKLLVAVPRIAGIGDPPGRDLEARRTMS